MGFLAKLAIQAYINGALSGANEWCAAVAPEQNLIFSTGPADAQTNLTRYSFGSGAVMDYADVVALGFASTFQSTIICDPSGNVWTVNGSIVEGQLAEAIPGAPWRLGATWGSGNTPPTGNASQPASMAWMKVGNANYIVGGGFAAAGANPGDIWVDATNPGGVGFAGHQFANSGGTTSVCAGPQGPMSSTAYWTSHPFSIFGTDYSLGKTVISSGAASYSISSWPTPNSGISSSIIKNYAPTDFDAAWTNFAVFSGPSYDHTDGNCLIGVSGSGGGNPNYICKLNVTTGAVMWKAIMPSANFDDQAFTLARIQNGRFIYYHKIGVFTGTCYLIDTATGAFTTQAYSGLEGIDQQVSDDVLGCIIGNGSWDASQGPIVLINNTPSSGGALTAIYFIESENHVAPLSAITYTRMFGPWQ